MSVEAHKAVVVFEFFSEVLGTAVEWGNLINLIPLELPQLDPTSLGNHCTEEDVWNTIRAWPVIRPDIMAVFDSLAPRYTQLSQHEQHPSNIATQIYGGVSIKDHRSISLIGIVKKPFSKVLTNRLAPKLDKLVHSSQGVFLRG